MYSIPSSKASCKYVGFLYLEHSNMCTIWLSRDPLAGSLCLITLRFRPCAIFKKMPRPCRTNSSRIALLLSLDLSCVQYASCRDNRSTFVQLSFECCNVMKEGAAVAELLMACFALYIVARTMDDPNLCLCRLSAIQIYQCSYTSYVDSLIQNCSAASCK